MKKNQLYYIKIHVNINIFVTWVSLSIFKKILIECLISYLDNLVLTLLKKLGCNLTWWKYELIFRN